MNTKKKKLYKNIQSKHIETKKIKKLLNTGGDISKSQTITNLIFRSNKISNQQNIDSTYKEIGIIHITESGAINILRSAATGIFNIIGSKGFDNVVYDKVRNEALRKIDSLLQENQKICNLRMEIENVSESQLFFIHIYGTLLEKK